jgi:type IV pilus assembly protein PilC
VNINGEKEKGKYFGQYRSELVKDLNERGYYLIKARADESLLNYFMLKKMSMSKISILCNQLYLMINAGMQVSEAFYLVSSVEKNGIFKKKLINVYNDIIKGKELYKSMELHRDMFPVFLIQMVRLGEQTGNLDIVLKNLYEYYERDSRIYSKLKNSMTYPIMVFITSSIVIMILLIKVVPQFTDTLITLGGELPVVTREMMLFCAFFKKYYAAIVILFITIFMLLKHLFKSRGGKEIIDSLKFRLPFIRSIYEKVVLSKFSRSMSTLLESGFNLISSFEICSGIIDNAVFKKKIETCLEEIKKGESLSFAFSNLGIKNPLFISLIRTGEETGELETVLKKAADFYEKDIEELLKRLITLIEPAMVIILALIIGAFVAAVMLPVLNIMDAIK